MVRILDATLREGEQTPGVCFRPHIKVAIARLLDRVGVDVVEAGHPLVSPRIEQAVRRVAAAGLSATVGAHARSRFEDVDRALDCGVGFLGVFYCVSEERLGHHATSLAEATRRIADVIRHAKRRDPDVEVRYTPEDTVRSPFPNVVRAAAAAVEAGADVISIADTTGYMIPGTERSMYDYVFRLRDALASAGLAPRLAVHCHNDRGLAVANALDAFRAGANVIDCSVLGLGERAGIVDLATLLAVLRADFGVEGYRLEALMELYELVGLHAGVPVPVHQPVTGANAFRHCAGVHTQAALADPLHYQSLDPALVGRRPTICLDHMSGMSAVRHALDAAGLAEEDPEVLARILRLVKEVGETGNIVDEAELPHIVAWCREAGNESLAAGGPAC